jgi:hypothetical protein
MLLRVRVYEVYDELQRCTVRLKCVRKLFQKDSLYWLWYRNKLWWNIWGCRVGECQYGVVWDMVPFHIPGDHILIKCGTLNLIITSQDSELFSCWLLKFTVFHFFTDTSYENMAKLKYFEMTVVNLSCIYNEMKNKLNSGNAWYHSVCNTLSYAV